MLKLKKLAAVAIGLAASMAASQAAIQINGTLGFIPFGDVTFTGPNLGAATSVNVPALEIVNTLPTPYNGLPNDFLVGPGAVNLGSGVHLSTTTLTLPVGAAIPGYLQFSYNLLSPGTTPVDRYVFDMTSVTLSSSGPGNLSLQGLGILHDLGNYYSDTPAVFSASFTTASPGTPGSVNSSFTLNTVPVPEPSTYIAGLGALALFGFTAIPKRKLQK